MSRDSNASPLVSVVIPAYNHEKFIGAAVESVLAQTCSELELIVVDDGSTDRTGEIVQQYTDTRLRYFHQENKDAYNTINRGLGLARGEFIAILNSDDIYAPNRLERLLQHHQESGARCIITDVVPISDEGEEFVDPQFGWNLWHQKNRDYYFSCNDIYQAFLKGNFMVTTSNLFMAAEVVRTVGDFSPLRYLHDYDYIFRIMLAFPGGVHYLADEKLLYYRIHSGNTLGEAAVIGRRQDQEVIRKYTVARVPEDLKPYIDAGATRLIELGDELHEVQSLLQPDQLPGVRPAARTLLKSFAAWLEKTTGISRKTAGGKPE